MKTAIPSIGKDAQSPAKSSGAPFSNLQSGRLAQLAAMMNQSPRVQAQLNLAEEIQNGEPVQRQMAMALEINHAQPAPAEPPHLTQMKHDIGRVQSSLQYEPHIQPETSAPLERRAAPPLNQAGQPEVEFASAPPEQGPSNGPQGGEVAQRVILLDSSELEWGFIVGARSMKKIHPGESINLLQKVDLSQLPGGENIRLVAHGHGEGGAFAGRTAEELASLLKARGLKLSAGAINLMSCQSGAGGSGSYVAELARQLTELHEVTGYQGIAATNLSGETVSFNPSPEHVERYKQITTRFNAQIEAANKIASEAGTKMNASGADVEAIVMEASSQIEALTGDLTAELVALNDEILRTRAAGRYVHKKKKIHYDQLSAKAKGFLERIGIEQDLQREFKEANRGLQAQIEAAGRELNASQGSDAAWERLNGLEADEAANERAIESSQVTESAYEFEFYRETRFASSDVVR